MSHQHILRVTGKGQLNLVPDQVRLSLEIEGTCPEYLDAVETASKKTKQLQEILKKLGFSKTDLKTTAFNVSPDYERYEVWDDERAEKKWESRLEGYEYRQTMKLEFDRDNERMGKILYALAHSSAHPEIRISYTIKDQEAAKNNLLAKAVVDAKSKAVILAKAANVELLGIQSMDYSWGKMEFEVTPYDGAAMMAPPMAAPSESFDYDIEPDDIQVEDTVTVIWEIS